MNQELINKLVEEARAFQRDTRACDKFASAPKIYKKKNKKRAEKTFQDWTESKHVDLIALRPEVRKVLGKMSGVARSINASGFISK